LLIVGGSLGAASINQLIFDSIDTLLENWTVVHVLGAAGIKEAPEKNGYLAFEYIGDEFGDVLAAADLVISRAGANALYELLALKKLHVLIPLGLGASRGDQLQNAALFERAGCSAVLHEQDATVEALLASIEKVWAQPERYRAAISDQQAGDGTEKIIELIDAVTGEKA
ncbi:MAG: glycosyltransferase, partial [Gammaproteobacteria bacterium]